MTGEARLEWRGVLRAQLTWWSLSEIEHGADAHTEIRQKRRGDLVSVPQGRSAFQPSVSQAINLNQTIVRVDNPILSDTVLGIELSLYEQIAAPIFRAR